MACEVCNFPDDDAHMLLRDFCNMGWHNYCLDPPLEELPPPKQSWLCPHCLTAGVTYLQLADVVRDRVTSRTAAPPAESSDNLWKQKHLAADKHAVSQNGLLIRRVTNIRGGKDVARAQCTAENRTSALITLISYMMMEKLK